MLFVFLISMLSMALLSIIGLVFWCICAKKHLKYESIKIHFVVLSIIVVFSTLLFCGVMFSSVTHREVRNYHITKISHQERYSKKIVYYVSVYAGRDSKGNSKYRRERRTRTDYFGPYFMAYSNSGNEYSISQDEYNKWKNLWGEKHIKTVKGSAAFLVKPVDGKYFESFYDGKFEHTYPKPEVHLYKNVLRNSNSVFGFKYGNGIKHPVDSGNTNGVISEIYLTDKEIEIFEKIKEKDNPDIIQARIDQYLELCEQNKIMPTVSGLALSFGINRATLWDWMTNTRGTVKNPEVVDILKTAYAAINTQYEELLTEGKMIPVSAFFLLQNNHGYKNQTDHVISANQDNPIALTDITERAGLLEE